MFIGMLHKTIIKKVFHGLGDDSVGNVLAVQT